MDTEKNFVEEKSTHLIEPTSIAIPETVGSVHQLTSPDQTEQTPLKAGAWWLDVLRGGQAEPDEEFERRTRKEGGWNTADIYRALNLKPREFSAMQHTIDEMLYDALGKQKYNSSNDDGLRECRDELIKRHLDLAWNSDMHISKDMWRMCITVWIKRRKKVQGRRIREQKSKQADFAAESFKPPEGRNGVYMRRPPGVPEFDPALSKSSK